MTTKDQTPEFVGLSVRETAKKSGCGRSIVYEAIASGRLRAKKLGRRTIVLEHDRQSWLDSLPAVKATAQ
ncbi:DNA-binding protein [Microvirga puerhi]|uniref:DNA-binding protein n=1 Tax=Microvirga puerhi TaxID=2876078 RepID=A0ABS7VVH6_9HYPH|nr:DNA-binding protein [Microvirga puerhi]MBZ6079179.1 DNA-binding protein [Microvirga puerhi]